MGLICQNQFKLFRRRRHSAFTLVELLVVISVIALLLSVLMPTLRKARRQGMAMVCMAHLKQLTLASLMYTDEYDGRLPPLYVAWDGINSGVSWLRYIVPYAKMDENLSTGDHDVFLYRGAEGSRANEEGKKSVLVCPEAARLCKLELNSPTYGRNGFGASQEDPLKLADCRSPSTTIFIADTLVADVTLHQVSNCFPVLGPSRMLGPFRFNGTFEDMGSGSGYHPAPHDNDSVAISWHDGHVSRHPKMKYADYEKTPSAWNFSK